MRFVLLAACLLAAPAAWAQMLPAGTWTGTVATGGRTHDATVELERCAAGFTVDLTTDGRTARADLATWERGHLRFTTDRVRMPGAVVPRALVCDLTAGEGGRLGGTCTAGRSTYRVTLQPPAGGAFGCD